jgi:hypothetical protein
MKSDTAALNLSDAVFKETSNIKRMPGRKLVVLGTAIVIEVLWLTGLIWMVMRMW